MIKDIEIENFRCFEKTKAKNFQRINLFTGKNNAGKTSFLEGLYLLLEPSNFSANSILNILRQSNEDKQSAENLFYNQNSKQNIILSSNILSSIGDTIFIKKNINYNSANFNKYTEDTSNIYKNVSFIFSKNSQLPNTLNLSETFDKLDIDGESKEILRAIQLIDNSIDDIKTYSSRPNILYLRKKNEKKYLPLYYFGDALQKIMRYVMTILSFKKLTTLNLETQNYLLIDEIENGLHYTVQEKFWEMIFTLAKEYDIQIFATTHSKEMVEAFKSIALQSKNTEEAAYFEMFKHIKKDEIIVQKIELDILEHNLENDKTFRGE